MEYIRTYGKHNKKTLTLVDMLCVTADIVGLRTIFTYYFYGLFLRTIFTDCFYGLLFPYHCLRIIAASTFNREYR